MCLSEKNFDAYAFSKQPDFDEAVVRDVFSNAVPLKTVVIYCFDPRAVGIPKAVAKEFGDVYPGTVEVDEKGNKVASSTTVFEVTVAGGRAIDALRSITVAQHLFGVENIVVVHHSHCGATSFTVEGIVDAFKAEQASDISELYQSESICISDYNASLNHDVKLLRQSSGTPKEAKVFGYMYDIDTEELTKVAESFPE